MNRAKFHKSLNNLVGWRERAFILALAERALPNAALYFDSLESQPLDPELYPDQLESLIDKIWLKLILKPDEEAVIELLDDALACMPDTEQVDHYGALPTQDMLRLAEAALLGGVNNEKRRALEASQIALETITQFIEFSEGEGLSDDQLVKLFDKHPLIEREFSFEQELSDTLRSSNGPSAEVIDQIRLLAKDEGVSNLGISLS